MSPGTQESHRLNVGFSRQLGVGPSLPISHENEWGPIVRMRIRRILGWRETICSRVRRACSCPVTVQQGLLRRPQCRRLPRAAAQFAIKMLHEEVVLASFTSHKVASTDSAPLSSARKPKPSISRPSPPVNPVAVSQAESVSNCTLLKV